MTDKIEHHLFILYAIACTFLGGLIGIGFFVSFSMYHIPLDKAIGIILLLFMFGGLIAFTFRVVPPWYIRFAEEHEKTGISFSDYVARIIREIKDDDD